MEVTPETQQMETITKVVVVVVAPQQAQVVEEMAEMPVRQVEPAVQAKEPEEEVLTVTAVPML